MRYKKHWRIGLIVLIVGLLAFGFTLTALGADRIGPILISGNDPSAPDLWNQYGYGCEDLISYKINVQNPTGTFTSPDGALTVTVSTPDKETGLTWSSNIPVYYVFAKGGSNGNLYIYPNGETSDSGILAPLTGGTTGPRADISHVTFYYCPPVEELTVAKTVETSYIRTHLWDIAKQVETDEGLLLEGIPKIWLVPDGSGDECAEWNVDVTYEGFTDSDLNVSGTVTIENIGTLDAVITDVEDLLGGTSINVDFGVTFPHTLAAGDNLVGTYSEDVASKIEGSNVVTVTTERDTYDTTEPIVWGDPDEEINETVNIDDDSDLFGPVVLGSVTAPNGDTFTYDECFAWTDYTAPGPYIYENTATIRETDQSAEATLKVNWEPPDKVCFADETAWAYGGDYANPNWKYAQGRNWGWTNGPLSPGFYAEWPLYAGAGQNDLSKGEIVGWVTVTYYDGSDPTIPAGCVEVIYQVDEGYYLGETHLWVGNDPLPRQMRGRARWVYTNAPGLFPYGIDYGFDPDNSDTWETEWMFYECGFKGDIYIAAHAVVWMEVDCPE